MLCKGGTWVHKVYGMLCKGVHGYTRYMTCYVRGTWVHKVYDMLCKGVHGYIYDMLCKGGT